MNDEEAVEKKPAELSKILNIATVQSKVPNLKLIHSSIDLKCYL